MRWVWALSLSLWAQGGVAIGQWGTYMYNGYIRALAYAHPYLWVLSNEGVALLDGENGGYRELSRATGLLYNRPTAIYGDRQTGWIFIGYGDGQMQYGPGPEALSIFRDIAANPLYTAKAIRDFAAKGDTLVIATDFGLVVWHKRRQRVLGTAVQFPGIPFATPVQRVRWAAGALWAFTQRGLYALPEGLAWTGPWQKRSGGAFLVGDSLQYFQGWVETPQGFLIAYKDSLYAWRDTTWAFFPLSPHVGRRVRSIGGEGPGWALSSDTDKVFFFSPRGDTTTMWNPGAIVVWTDPTAQYRALGSGWIGAFFSTPKVSEGTDAYQRLRSGSVTEVLPTSGGLFFLHGGSGFWGSGWGKDITYYPHGARQGRLYNTEALTGRSFANFTEAAWDGSRAWILCGNGILRLSPEGAIDTFTAYNAPFDGVFPDANGFPTILGFRSLAWGRNGAMWAGKYFGIRNLVVYIPATNTWQALPFSDPVLQVRVDRRGYIWVLHAGGKLRVIDDRGNPAVPAGYRVVVLGSGGQPLPQLPGTTINAIASDRTGAIWIGTDRGVAVLYGDPFDGTLSVSLPVIENRYLLEEESITDIAIDGQNRKWIGTYGSGVYVISPDGTRQLANFNETNSPLASNLVFRIRPWDYTGEIFMITSEGAVSYRDWATEPAERLDSLYIFPNPVSRQYEGWIGIRGVSEASTVRIFTVDGQQLRYLQTFGGQAVWDLRTLSGEKVSPGVYLISALDAEGQRSAVGKIVVTD